MIVNEFGEVGIDGDLIVADEEALIEIRNGCICCTVRTDLVAGVKLLLERSYRQLDRLIVETSGLADPAPVLQTFLADTDLLTRVELESVVTLVDAANFQRQIDDGVAREQIAFADVIVLNKVDLLDPDDIAPLERDLRTLNPIATFVRTVHSEVAADGLLGVHGSHCRICSPSNLVFCRTHMTMNMIIQLPPALLKPAIRLIRTASIDGSINSFNSRGNSSCA